MYFPHGPERIHALQFGLVNILIGSDSKFGQEPDCEQDNEFTQRHWVITSRNVGSELNDFISCTNFCQTDIFNGDWHGIRGGFKFEILFNKEVLQVRADIRPEKNKNDFYYKRS